MKGFVGLLAACLFALPLPLQARPHSPPRNFLYLGQDELEAALPMLDRPDISGVQVLYIWKNLEPARGVYDFSMIEHDLAIARAHHRQFWLQIEDRFFQPNARWLPEYLLTDPEFGGGWGAPI